MIRLSLDIENEELKEEVKNLISKIDYPLRFERIIIGTSYKTAFLGGDANKDLEISINPKNKVLENNRLFRGYFARFIFLLVNEKEGLNQEIKKNLELQDLTKFVQNFFGDYKAVKYGFKKQMHDFYIEKISRRIYEKKDISKGEYLEFYSFYLISKKMREEDEINALMENIKVPHVKPVLRELEKLNYPYFFGDEKLKKAWTRAFYL